MLREFLSKVHLHDGPYDMWTEQKVLNISRLLRVRGLASLKHMVNLER